jgi:hypothetical protein
MKKLRDYEKEKLEEMLDGQGWKVFLSILEEEKEEKKNLLVSYIAN